MTYASSKHIDRSAIPLIDISRLWEDDPQAVDSIGTQIRKAAQDIGFFYITGHGVPRTVFDRANMASRAYFAKPLGEKQRNTINRHHRGFLEIGQAKMSGAKRVDLKESYVFGLELSADDPMNNGTDAFLGHNQWPAEMPEFRDAMVNFFDSLSGVAVQLMRVFAHSMALDESAFIATSTRPVSRGSSVYYPAQAPDLGDQQFGVAPHTDYGCLTLVWQDDTGGLEIQDPDGNWLTAHPIDNALVVNVGDLLARWTNDQFKSTPHRVVNRSGRERYSMALFWDPNSETVIDPAVVCRHGEAPKYPPTTVGDYVLSKYAEAFAYRS